MLILSMASMLLGFLVPYMCLIVVVLRIAFVFILLFWRLTTDEKMSMTAACFIDSLC